LRPWFVLMCFPTDEIFFFSRYQKKKIPLLFYSFLKVNWESSVMHSKSISCYLFVPVGSSLKFDEKQNKKNSVLFPLCLLRENYFVSDKKKVVDDFPRIVACYLTIIFLFCFRYLFTIPWWSLHSLFFIHPFNFEAISGKIWFHC
jgi:hypothetical protein